MARLDPEKQQEFAVEVVRRLREAGYQALWAGGCVRDLLLGGTPKDYDVATDARPEAIREVFGRKRTMAVGAAFGVMMIRGPRGAGTVEVATFREDAEYSDGRHPDSVTFSDAEHDAQRRDFTINGMFYDPLTREVIDYIGGQEDLEKQIVRAIGDPRARFAEDKLRLMRAVRFAATFEFALEAETKQAVREMAGDILTVSAERIQAELARMLAHPRRERAARLLRETDLQQAILPELEPLAEIPPEQVELVPGSEHPPELAADLWTYSVELMSVLEEPSFPLALAALLLKIGVPRAQSETGGRVTLKSYAAAGGDLVVPIGRRLRISVKEEQRTEWLVRRQGDLFGATEQPWSRLQRLLIQDGIEELVLLHAAQLDQLGLPDDDIRFCRERLDWPAEKLNPPPLLDGNDLIEQGFPRGPLYKVILDRVRTAQLDGEIHTPSEALALANGVRGELE